MNTPRRFIRLTDDQVSALESLAAEMNISGQRGARLNAMIGHIADTAMAAHAETVASLEIATQCAAGADWYELIEIVEPEWPPE